MGRSVTPQNPCPICGKPDWCYIIDGQNGPLFYCKRVREDSVVSGGEVYNLVKTTDQCGCYEAKSQQEAARAAFIEKLKAENPNYKPKSNSSYKKKAPKATASAVAGYVDRRDYEQQYNLPTADGRVLNKVYSTFLDCLILEDNHKKMLIDEWGEKIFNNLTKRSRFGTEDDISLACVFDENLLNDSISLIRQRVEENKQEAADRKAETLRKQV